MSGSFTLDVQRFVTKAKGNVDLVVRRVALDMFRRVIMKSPVGSGRFKGNWQVSIGSIPAGTVALVDKSGKGQVGSATMAKATAETLNLRAGQIIYLVNNLPYSRRLEYGYSKQAPAGMVRLSVAEYSAVVIKAPGDVSK
jgi:hypothetical protein